MRGERKELGYSEKYRHKILLSDVDILTPDALKMAAVRTGMERRENWVVGGKKGKAGDGFEPPACRMGESRLGAMMREYARRNGGEWPYF
jgi:hypothetical protein